MAGLSRALYVPNLPELPSDDDVINPKLDFEAIQVINLLPM